MFLVAGASADATTASTVAGAFVDERFAGALATSFSAMALTGVLADVLAGADLVAVAALAAEGAFAAGFLAVATLVESVTAFDAEARLTGFFDSVTGSFVSFLFTISGALQAACVWATLTSC